MIKYVCGCCCSKFENPLFKEFMMKAYLLLATKLGSGLKAYLVYDDDIVGDIAGCPEFYTHLSMLKNELPAYDNNFKHFLRPPVVKPCENKEQLCEQYLKPLQEVCDLINSEIKKPVNKRRKDIAETADRLLNQNGFLIAYREQDIAEKEHLTSEEAMFLVACKVMRNPNLFNEFIDKYQDMLFELIS